MLLRHGASTPSRRPGRPSIAAGCREQRFDEAASNAGVRRPARRRRRDLTSRKAAIALRAVGARDRRARGGRRSPGCRAFRGIDTLTALSIHLELGGDWQRFQRASALRAWLGLTPSLSQSGESSRQGSITKTGSMLARRLLVESAWHYGRQPRLGATLANRQAGQPDHILAIANRAQQRLYTRQPQDESARQAAQRHRRRVRAPARRLPLGRRHRRLTPADSPTVGGPGRRAISGRHARHSYEQRPPRRASRSLLDSARRQHETGP